MSENPLLHDITWTEATTSLTNYERHWQEMARQRDLNELDKPIVKEVRHLLCSVVSFIFVSVALTTFSCSQILVEDIKPLMLHHHHETTVLENGEVALLSKTFAPEDLQNEVL